MNPTIAEKVLSIERDLDFLPGHVGALRGDIEACGGIDGPFRPSARSLALERLARVRVLLAQTAAILAPTFREAAAATLAPAATTERRC